MFYAFNFPISSQTLDIFAIVLSLGIFVFGVYWTGKIIKSLLKGEKHPISFMALIAALAETAIGIYTLILFTSNLLKGG